MKRTVTIFSTLIFLLLTTAIQAQTEIGIAPGESAPVEREHSISILPVTNVTIEVLGEDSVYVGAELDSFRVIEGRLKVKSNYTLSVSNAAPIGELHVEVVLTYSADGEFPKSVSENFVINTSVQPSIVADFKADPLTGSLPLLVNFSNQSSGNILGYMWDFGDSSTSTEANPQHTYQEPGLYTVSLTVFNFDVQNKKIKENYINAGNISGLKDIQHKANRIYLAQNYPNPFNPKTTIRYYLPQKEHVEISLYNILGKLVFTLYNDVQSAGEHKIILDASALTSGVYFYSLKTDNYSSTKKLIVNK